MTLRHGRFGPFLGCSRYPECKGIVNIAKKGEKTYRPEDLPSCPAIGCDGHMTARKSRFGKTFFSCSNYPDCDVIASTLDQLPIKYPNHPKTAYVKKKGFKKGSKATKETTSKASAKKTSKKKKTSHQPAATLSKELAEIVGSTSMSRPEVTKQLWVYIKTNKLQDPKNKRMICPDEKLSKVIGKKPVDMMKLAGLLSKHLKT
jgi:DNA topoisomerase-1